MAEDENPKLANLCISCKSQPPADDTARNRSSGTFVKRKVRASWVSKEYRLSARYLFLVN